MRLSILSLVLALGFLLAVFSVWGSNSYNNSALVPNAEGIEEEHALSNGNHTPINISRKLLALPAGKIDDYDDGNGNGNGGGDGNGNEGGDGNGNGGGDGSMNRIGAMCSKDNIVIFQGPNTPLPNGIPTYTVQIQNVCVSGSCSISNIHLNCGWFSSARLINPSIFKRICYNDCLVNDGQPLGPGEALSFQYANSFPYQLSVSSVVC